MVKKMRFAATAPADGSAPSEAGRRVLELLKRDTPGNKLTEEVLNKVIDREIHLYHRRRRTASRKRSIRRSA